MTRIYKVKWLRSAGLTLWPIIFINPNYTSNILFTINHEKIHIEQHKEMLIVLFYLWYGIEWIINIFKYGIKNAYKMISFEQEGYYNRSNLNYIKNRKRFAWMDYLNFKPVK